MEEKVEHLVGICGLYCGSCPSYLAHRNNDVATQEKMSRALGRPAEDLRCDGCLSGRVSVHCKECTPGFRRCASEHGVTYCFECTEFPCGRLEVFKDAHVVKGVSHHARVIEDLAEMKAHGLASWVARQRAATACPKCGRALYWFDRHCSACGENLPGDAR